jgi:hypothetical protein
VKEISKPQEYAAIGLIFVLFQSGLGSFAVWAADQRYSQKADIEALETTVKANNAAQNATIASVDILLVQVLDIRIGELETVIRELEAQDDLTSAEQGLLAQRRRELEDSRAERQATLSRILARRIQ